MEEEEEDDEDLNDCVGPVRSCSRPLLRGVSEAGWGAGCIEAQGLSGESDCDSEETESLSISDSTTQTQSKLRAGQLSRLHKHTIGPTPGLQLPLQILLVHVFGPCRDLEFVFGPQQSCITIEASCGVPLRD